MKNVTMKSFQQEVLDSDKPVLVDVWAAWCGPCKFLTPILDTLQHEHPEIKFVKLNADENYPLLEQFGVSGLPSLLLFRGGKEVRRAVGYQPKQRLMQTLGL